MNNCIRRSFNLGGVSCPCIESIVASHDVLQSFVACYVANGTFNIMSVCIGAVYRTNIQSTITRRRNLNRTIAVGLVINAGSFILCCFNCIVVSKYRIILEVIFEEVYKAGDHSLSFELVLTCKCKNFFLACTGISCRLNFSFTGGDYF